MAKLERRGPSQSERLSIGLWLRGLRVQSPSLTPGNNDSKTRDLGLRRPARPIDADAARRGVVSEIIEGDETPTVERPNPLAYAAAYQRQLSLVDHFLMSGGRVLARVLGRFPKRKPVYIVAERGIDPDPTGWTVDEQPLTARLSRYVFRRAAEARS
jgi:hypothetical protein